MTLGRSWPVGTINLTGVAVNATGTLSWANSNQTPTLGQYQTDANGWLELVNMSACLLDIEFPSGDAQPLPPGSWRTFELGLADNSLTWMALTNTQNAANNTVYAYYYPLSSGPPPTGQVVNQSQAVGAYPVVPSIQFSIAAGSTSPQPLQIIGPGGPVSGFTFQEIAISFVVGSATGGTGGIGRMLFVTFAGAIAGVGNFYIQERTGNPFVLQIPNVRGTGGGGTGLFCNVQTVSGAVFSMTGYYTFTGFNS